jgi:hypothetical protein
MGQWQYFDKCHYSHSEVYPASPMATSGFIQCKPIFESGSHAVVVEVQDIETEKQVAQFKRISELEW